jgi:hypothetical protein
MVRSSSDTLSGDLVVLRVSVFWFVPSRRDIFVEGEVIGGTHPFARGGGGLFNPLKTHDK